MVCEKSEKPILTERIKMKNIYLLLICSITLMMGCSIESPVNSGVESYQKTWISIPVSDGMSIENSLFASAKINGNQGGELILQGSYQSISSKVVTVYSKTVVPANAYSGTETLTQLMGTETYSEFGPSKVFNQPLLLSYSITGIDLSGLSPDDIDFYYMNTKGNFEPVQYDVLEIDTLTGTLKVINARIHHFSRYGWAK
jgi:hypothetical protein